MQGGALGTHGEEEGAALCKEVLWQGGALGRRPQGQEGRPTTVLLEAAGTGDGGSRWGKAARGAELAPCPSQRNQGFRRPIAQASRLVLS